MCWLARVLLPVLSLVALLCAPQVQADVAVTGGFTRIPLGLHWEVWEDASLRRDSADLPPASEWHESVEAVPNFGFSDSAFWFRTRITSNLLWRQTLYLYIANPLLSEVDVYWLPDGEAPRWYQAGLHYPFSSRVIRYREYLFPLQLPAKGQGELLLRVRSQASVQLPASLVAPATLISEQEHSIVLLGISLGVPVIILCYNLLLFFIVRERSYLYFSLHALSALLFVMVWQGLMAEYFLPDNVVWRARELAVSALLATFFSNLFAEHYLGLKKRRFFLLPIYRSIRFLCGAMLMVLWFLPEGVSNVVAMLLASASAACISIAVINSFSAGGRAVRIFCIAWLVLVGGVLLLALNKIGFMSMPLLADQALLIGLALEVTMIAFALADRLNAERYLKLHAQETALHHAERERQARLRVLNEEHEAQRALSDAVEMQRTLHQTLESQVLERTHALEQAHQRLLTLYEEDLLTGLKNRRHFSERFTEECKRARQRQHTLAILLVDMDHFKRINDH